MSAGIIKRAEIKNCPPDATHVLLNPKGEFIELFYKVEGNDVKYKSFANLWMGSHTQMKNPKYIEKLTLIVD